MSVGNPDDPMCRQITVSVSTHASISGSHAPECSVGRPRRWGSSGNVSARNPRAALRRTSAAASTGSARYVIPIGMLRSGCGEYHSSWYQSFHARTVASAELGIGAAPEHRAAEAGDLRREVHRRPHAVEVHVVHARFDVVTAGSDLVEARRLERPLVARTAGDRAEAGELEALALEHPRLVAVVVLDHVRCARLQSCRQPPFEHPGRLDEVVVDRDHGQRDRPGLGIGQQAMCSRRRHRASIVTARPGHADTGDRRHVGVKRDRGLCLHVPVSMQSSSRGRGAVVPVARGSASATAISWCIDVAARTGVRLRR